MKTLPKVFIVGESGTTGLRLQDRLSERKDIELLHLPEDKRKDIPTIQAFAKEADLMFLCLPDAASKEVVEAVKDIPIRILDTSTAHRTDDDWVYGFPELSKDQKEAISKAQKVAVPGCHASGVISILYPLIHAGILPINYPLHCFSLTGYSGGGKKMIAEYEGESRDPELDSPRQYGLTQKHKHLPEMQVICGLSKPPMFSPIVADYYSGMEVTVFLYPEILNLPAGTADALSFLHGAYRKHYGNSCFVKVRALGAEQESRGFFGSNNLSGRDDMEIYVSGNNDRILVTSRFDNLGKGASGAAVQNMNIALGLDEATGLNVNLHGGD